MARPLALAILVVGGLLVTPANAATTITLPGGGGLDRLTVVVDVAKREVRYASCKALPCEIPLGSRSLAITSGVASSETLFDTHTHTPTPTPTPTPIDEGRVTLLDVPIGGGRHLAHVKIPLTADTGPEAVSWEALLVSGSPPLFAGLTGFSNGEPGERTGTDVRFLEEGERVVVVVGDIREDLRICGDDATLLEPRGLDPSTLLFRSATLQRLSVARRESAIAITATPRRADPEPALAPLLLVSNASSGKGDPKNLVDGNPTTAWAEARPGRGQGEFVLLRAPYEVPILRLAITPTPPLSPPSAMSQNTRASAAAPETFFLATGTHTYAITFPEDAWSHPGEAYDITFPEPLRTSCVALVLGDAFERGLVHPDVTIAELTAYSSFDHVGSTLGEVTAALQGGGPSAQAAAAILERAGKSGLAAVSSAYASLDEAGRALALNVAASSESCKASAPLLVQALTDKDDVVREKAHAKLEQPTCGHEAIAALTNALKLSEGRLQIAPLLAFLARARAVEPLFDVLGDGEPKVRRAVRSALAYAVREAPASEVSRLLQSADKTSAETKLDLLRALEARLGESKSAADSMIVTLLSGLPAPFARYLLLEPVATLSKAGDELARNVLANLAVHDPDPHVRSHAIEFVEMGDDANVVMSSALRDAEPRVREAALRALTESPRVREEGTNVSVAPVVASLLQQDAWAFVRAAAADALATLPRSMLSHRALGVALKERSPRVREQATLAVARHGDKTYADVIRAHVLDTEEDSGVRSASIRALGMLCDAASVAPLAELAVKGGSSTEADEVSLGLVATEALGQIHPPDLALRLARLHSKMVRPDARIAADHALASTSICRSP